jgi:hypothetical protein
MIDVVIFTCTGREHLLSRTLRNLKTFSQPETFRHILSVDGELDCSLSLIKGVDVVISGPKRLGYPRAILRTLNYVQSDKMLWIEDDWEVENIDLDQIEHAVETLDKNPTIFQVRWPKDDNSSEPTSNFPSLKESPYHFSANPNLNRAEYLKGEFNSLAQVLNKGGVSEQNLGFETFIDHRVRDAGFTSLVFDSSVTNLVNHLGYLESTDRNWHFIGSESVSVYVNHPIGEAIDTHYSITSTFARFFLASLRTLIRIPFKHRSRETAFRFIQSQKSDIK